MGYQDITLYHLKFEKRDGLEVTAEGLSTGALLNLIELTAQLGTDPAAAAMNASARPVVEELMNVLAGALVDWNIEDRRNQPVPQTVDGLKSLNLGLVMDIITAWIEAQSGVDDELGKDSSSGETSAPVPQLPMVPRSPNPRS